MQKHWEHVTNKWSILWFNCCGLIIFQWFYVSELILHYDDVIMGVIASQITSLTIVYPIVYSDADQRKHQSSASLAFVRGIHRGPMNSPHKWPIMRKMFPFDDVIMGKNNGPAQAWYNEQINIHIFFKF